MPMMDKKREIMEAAIRCFAAKGYRAASIQEIADSLGMAKGSLYFYFKSKEDILVSICRHHVEMYGRRLDAMAKKGEGAPEERLRRFIVSRFEQLAQYRDVIKLFMQERFEANEEIHGLFQALRLQTLGAVERCIVECYGAGAEAFAFDAAVSFIAVVNGFMSHHMLERLPLRPDDVAAHCLARLDDMVRGMMAAGKPPLLEPALLRPLVAAGRQGGGLAQAERLSRVREAREALEALELDAAVREEAESALLLLEAELEKSAPQPLLIKGLLALLRGLRIPGLRRYIAAIAKDAAP